MKAPLILLGDLAPVGLSHLKLEPLASNETPALILANLETALGGPERVPSAKAGPVLRGNASALEPFAAHPGLVLAHANNHAMDLGAAGLAATRSWAAKAGVPLIGVGVDASAAAAAHTCTHHGIRVAIMSITEPWFGIATAERPGVNALDAGVFARINQLRREVDRVIVSVHGGNEMSPWPSPRWQATLRAFADAGADVVHAHHPHVTQGWERWAGSWIFYGLGNTLVNPHAWAGSLRTLRSWRASLDLADMDRPPEISAWECRLDEPEKPGAVLVRLPDPTAAEISSHQGPLSDPALLAGLHQEYALRLWDALYADRAGLGETSRRRIRLVLRTLRDAGLALVAPDRWQHIRRNRMLFHYHVAAAPGHADEIATALGILSGERTDDRTAITRQLADEWMPPSLFKS